MERSQPVTAVTVAQQERITVMRRAGVTYQAIATHLELNTNTVKTWCRRAHITPDPTIEPVNDPLGVWCLNCGTPITGNHEPIIAPAVWDFVQSELTAPVTGRRSTSRQRTFSGKIRCAQCGAWYGSKTWHARSKYEKRIWRCNHKYAGHTRCATPHVSDEQITTAFLDAVHTLLASRSKVDEVIDNAVLAELDTTDLHIEADQLFAQVGAAAEAIDALIARNARVAQDQTEYQRRFDKLNTEHARLLADYHKLLTQISDLENRQAAYRYYKEQVATLDPASIKFTPYLWHTLIDHADIATDGTISFTFRDDAKQTQPIGK